MRAPEPGHPAATLSLSVAFGGRSIKRSRDIQKFHPGFPGWNFCVILRVQSNWKLTWQGHSMQLRSRKTIRRIIIIMDNAATSAAFVLALYLRMWTRMEPWKVRLYSTVYILNLLLYLFWNTYRRAKKHEYDITQMDPVENLVRVARERIFQYAALIILLAVVRSFEQLSRQMLLYWVFFDILFTAVLRLKLRTKLLLEQTKYARRHYVLLVTTKEKEAVARARLSMLLKERDVLAGVCLLDRDQEPESDFLETWLSNVRRQTACHEEAGDSASPALKAFLYLPNTPQDVRDGVISFLQGKKIPVSSVLFDKGRCLPYKMVCSMGGYAAMEYDTLSEQCKVFGVSYAVSDVETAAFSLLDLMADKSGRPAGKLSGEYICFSNVHTLMMAQDDAEYFNILNGSAFTFPDGAPIAEYQKRRGFSRAERVAGPDLMDAVFRATMDGSIRHYFYGSTQETIDKLRVNLEKRYPGIQIAGMVSPPFREETEEEDAETVRRINESGADIVWIGLGAPKQERWMARHKGMLGGVMMGVGAGFDFYAETIKRAPVWCRKIGMEWFYRLCQDPGRLANRYIVTNVQYALCLIREHLHLGKKR